MKHTNAMRQLSLAPRPMAPARPVRVDRSTRVESCEQADETGMHDYQVSSVSWMRPRKNALLGHDMGLGKSVISLRALPRKPRAIVVCPASVTLTWQREVEKWRRDLYVTVGEALRRPRENEVLAISYDSLPDLRRGCTRLIDEPLSDVFLIFDECQMIMNEGAQRTQKARSLRAQCGSCWGLSATPMLGDPEDLWGVLVSLGLAHIYGDRATFIEMCGGSIRWIWDKRLRPYPRSVCPAGKCKNPGYCQHRRAGYEWGEISPEVKKRLGTVMLRYLADDVLDELPERQEIELPVEAPADLVPYLNQIKEQWDGLDQNDLPPFELLSEARAALARSRIPAAVEFADNTASEDMPLLVFSAHVDPVLEVGKLKGAGCFVGGESAKEKERLLKAFQAGELRILAMTIKTGGAGLNLQQAGGVLFVDRDYTPTMNAQAVGRARRQGNVRKRVVVWTMVSDHALDVRLNAILTEKQRVISAAVG